MQQPLISTIIPVHNGARYLAEAIESVLAQPYCPLEVLVVADGSTDASAAFAQSFPLVSYYYQAQRGAAAARNRKEPGAMKFAAWRYYRNFLRGDAPIIVCGMLLAFGQALFVLPIAFLLRYVFDTVIPAGNLQRLVLCGLALLLLHLAGSGLNLWMKHLLLRVTKDALRNFRAELLLRVYAFSRAYYTQADRSRLHATIVYDSERLDTLGDALAGYFLPSVASCLALSLVLLLLNWELFLVLLALAPLLLWAHQRIKYKIQARAKAYRQSFHSFSQGMQFISQMLDLTKLQTAEECEIARQRERLAQLRQAGGALQALQNSYNFLQHALLMGVIAAILIVGGRSVAAGTMSLGALVSFYFAAGLFSTYLRTALLAATPIMVGAESLAALYEIINAADAPPYTGSRRIDFRGGIACEAVQFRYHEQVVLNDLSFKLEPGQTLVVAGPNGSGKTTLLNLLLGFYRPQQGRVCIDGQPLSELDLVHWRRALGVVTQNPAFIPGTIEENIAYGSAPVEEARIVEAARLATADAFIQTLPQGYATQMGEGGVLLSGGQRQRIAVARALLRRPKLLILDEPTNHLDAATVEQLLANLRQLETPPTTLIITHDPQLLPTLTRS